MAAFFDVTRTYLRWHGHPTGIPRFIYGLCSTGIKPVVFHVRHRQWYQIPVFTASSRLAKQSKNPIFRVREKFERLKALEKQGTQVRFHPEDSLFLLDLNLSSIPNYARSIEKLKEKSSCPTLIGFIHDLFPIHHSEDCPTFFRREFRDWTAFVKKNCDRILTNSEEVKKSAEAYFVGKPVGSVRFGSRVQPSSRQAMPVNDLLDALAHARRDFPEMETVRQRGTWILSVGVLDRRKNHRLLFEALGPLWEAGQLDVPLVIVGRPSSEEKSLKRTIEASSVLRKFVFILGSVSDELLWDLYRGACLSVLPSSYEGFGFPVSESLQLGCPCFASRVGGVPEVAGDLIEYFDPHEPVTLRAIVERYFSDARFAEDLRSRARRFTPYEWHQTLDDILGSPQLRPPKREIPPIDAVYLWCDGSGEGDFPYRFRSHDELRYSLRSIEAHAPWIRRIYVVTNGQVPPWMRQREDRLRLISHRELFENPADLPCFNAHAIESYISRIPGLSEYFLYLNDDFFIGAPLDPETYFCPDGAPIFFVERYPLPAPNGGRWGDDLVKRCHRYNHRLLLRHLQQRLDFRDPPHVPQLYRRDTFRRLEEEWKSELRSTRQNRFRNARDAKVPVLYPYFASESGKVDERYRLRTLYNDSSEYVFKTIRDQNVHRLDLWFSQVRRSRPRFFCFNDAILDSKLAEQVGSKLREMLGDYFPSPSRFEGA